MAFSPLKKLITFERNNTKDFNYKNYPLNLNLGCGYDIRDNYLNIDFQAYHKPDLVADIRDLNMLPSNYYEEIIAQDVLEHMLRTETQLVLKEWNRLLKQDGIIRLRLPNVIGILKLFTWDEYNTIEKHQKLIQCLFGTQAYNGDYHHTSFTELLIRDYLKKSNFKIISIQSKDEWLFDVIAKKL